MPGKQIVALAVFMSFLTAAHATDVVQGGWHDRRFPVPVLHLEGDIADVARAHGQLAARQSNGKTTIRFLSEMVAHRLESSPQLANYPLVRAAMEWLYGFFVQNPMIEHIPLEYREAYAELAKGLGLDEDEVLSALTLPDAALRSVSLLYSTELGPLFPANFGCTSIIWNSGANSVLHGRNLDYEGVGVWDRNPVILHVIPKNGLAHVAVTALGVHAPGITAFNEAGLTLAMHQLTMTDTSAAGTPMPIISAEVIRNARTIDDAIAIIRGFPRSGSWAYVLSQGRDRAVVETSASEVAIRRSSERFFYQTNHVSSPALAQDQVFYTPGSWIDSHERANLLQTFRKKGGAKGWATPQKLAQLLRSYGEPQRTRVASGTIAKLDNIQSVIMDAANRRLWIAVGGEKHAPNEGHYVEYRWSDLRAASPPQVNRATVPASPATALGAKRAELRKLLRQAVATADERSALLKTYVTKSAKVSAPGSWPGLYLYVWNELRDAEDSEKQAKALLETLDQALSDPDLNANSSMARHRFALGHLYRGRLLDLMNRRGEALHEYGMVARLAPFARLQRAARNNMKRPFTWTNARATSIDWAGVDLFTY